VLLDLELVMNPPCCCQQAVVRVPVVWVLQALPLIHRQLLCPLVCRRLLLIQALVVSGGTVHVATCAAKPCHVAVWSIACRLADSIYL